MATGIIGLLLPFLGTMLGSAFVFFMKKDMPVRLQKALLGFASGVMVAASVWSLLIPAIEAEADKGPWAVMPAALGFLLGILVILLAAWLTPILHYLLAFAAGAMLYVVVEEFIPEASQGTHSNLSTIGFAIGFVLMMVLDVVLG